MISHGDVDHYAGYSDVVNPKRGGFDVMIGNFEPGTKKRSGKLKSRALNPASQFTSAGAFKTIIPGYSIPLGDGARATVIAANGKVWDEKEEHSTKSRKRPRVPRLNENDRSISLFVEFGQFRYVLDGDLGSGREKCTDHITS